MRRIILLAGVAVLMASFVVVSALPALAADESITLICSAPNGAFIFVVGTGEVPRNDLGYFRQLCKSEGGTLTLQANPEPGPPSDRPPCCAPPTH
jgi:hypothetical protein